jgi:hypothetical protein
MLGRPLLHSHEMMQNGVKFPHFYLEVVLIADLKEQLIRGQFQKLKG